MNIREIIEHQLNKPLEKLSKAELLDIISRIDYKNSIKQKQINHNF